MTTHTITSLKTKRSELAGKVEHLENELEQVRRDLTYVDGALHVFGYGEDPAKIKPKPKRYRPTLRLFSHGELQRTLFDQLRISPDGVDTTELTDRIMRHKGWDTTDSDFRAGVTHKIGNVLWKLRKRGQVHGEADGATNVWRLG